MSWFFSKPPDPALSATSIRQTIQSTRNREVQLRGSVLQEQQLATQYACTDKNLALNHMRRKKMFEGQLGRVQGNLMALEQQMAGLEDATMTKETVESMRLVNKSLRGVHRTIDIDSVDDTLDDTDDLLQEQQSISDRIASSVPSMDDDALLDELDDLVGANIISIPVLPEAPKAELPGQRNVAGLDSL